MKKTEYEVINTGNRIIVPIGKYDKGEVVDRMKSFAGALVLANLISLETGLPLGSDESALLRAVESGAIDLGDAT